ncbi:MAG: helix-turn-helix domain-containing protein [Eubacteriales bacterium]|nr:helix-turn-helix domain-containing protein [Eubacteriales bacterium]
MIDLDILLHNLKIDYTVHRVGAVQENPFAVEFLVRIETQQFCIEKTHRYGLILMGDEDLCLCTKTPAILSESKLLLVIIGDRVLDSFLTEAAAFFSGTIISILAPPEDRNKIYCRIMQEIETQNLRRRELIERHYLDLVSLLARGATIGEIEKFGSMLLHNPMIITDETFAVLAYSQEYSVADPVWEEIIKNQYSPSELVSKTDVNQFWKRLDNSNLPLFVDDTAFRGCTKRAVARMKSGSNTKGYIALLEINRKITSLDLYILQMLAEVLSARLNEEDAISKATGQMRNDFATDILKGDMASRAMILSRAKSLQISFSRWNAVLCVYVDKKDRYIGRELPDLSYILKKNCSLCLYAFDGTYGYFILSFREKSTWAQILNPALQEQAQQNHYIFTLSLPTEELTQISNCYSQVLAMNHALSLRENPGKQRLYSYHNMVPYHMITRLYESEEKLFFKSRALETLLEADSSTGSLYVDTLRSFFENNQNVTQTASALFVHRNTINYRLNKVRSLLDDDFDDPLVRLHLHIAILAHDLYE